MRTASARRVVELCPFACTRPRDEPRSEAACLAQRLWYTAGVPALFCPSPLGPLLLIGTSDALCEVRFLDAAHPEPPLSGEGDSAPLRHASRQLHEYFAGKRRRFELPLSAKGTEFQRRVWRALAEIPFGTTTSYGEIARRIGRPRAVRAVGGANNKNPLSIVIPCHRVVGRDGSLVGYGGGLGLKRWLLEHEGAPFRA